MSAWIEQLGLMLVAQADGAPAPSAEIESVWDFVMKGGIMMIPIGLCSLVAMTVVAERLVMLRRARVIPGAFLQTLKRALGPNGGERARALAYCRKDDSSVARVFAAGIRRLGGPLEVVERNIQEAGQREVLRLRKHLRVLSVIAAVSPLLGLLGTIFGMIRAFQTVATSAEALGRTELLAEGIYEAMITTAAGLIVAIPVLICYHWLSARVQKLVMDIDQMTVDFVEEHVARAQKTSADAASGAPDAETDALAAAAAAAAETSGATDSVNGHDDRATSAVPPRPTPSERTTP